MGEKYLIDTSAAIKYLNETFPATGHSFMNEVVDLESIISFVSQIELQVWNPPDPNELDVYYSFVAGSTIIGIYPDIIQQTIRIRKEYKLKLPDALIAATALTNDFTLLADNDADFKRVTGLKYINPMQLN
jgi:predicted nucleic acid-binding protein